MEFRFYVYAAIAHNLGNVAKSRVNAETPCIRLANPQPFAVFTLSLIGLCYFRATAGCEGLQQLLASGRLHKGALHIRFNHDKRL